MFKTILIFTLVGTLLGITAASFVVPRTLKWYNEAGYQTKPLPGQPAGQSQTLVNLPNLIDYTTDRLLKGQLIGGIAGAVIFFVFGVFGARSGARRRREAVAAAARRDAAAASRESSGAPANAPVPRPGVPRP
jgi:hypothetical protein